MDKLKISNVVKNFEEVIEEHYQNQEEEYENLLTVIGAGGR